MLAGLILFLGAAGGWWVWSSMQSDQPPTQQSSKTAEDEPTFQTVSGKYIFSGTVVLGRAVERAARNSDGSYDHNYPFSGLDSMNFDQYDMGVFDLECPSTGRRIPYEVSVSTLQFDCHPDYFKAAKDYYQVMNLAGNHTYDAGEDGFNATVDNIQSAGLQAVGRYDPRVTEDLCEAVAVPVRLNRPEGQEEQATLPIAICTFHYQFHLTPQAGELEEIQKYSEVMPVIAMMHSGVEYTRTINDIQRDVARTAIDNGAEFMVGNGAHWVQPTEVYNGKLIVYSTGNFIFDQTDYDTHIGFNLSAAMNIDYDQNIKRWIQLAEDCQAQTRGDNCLELARQQGLEKFSPDWEFEAVGSYGGYMGARWVPTVKANQPQQADIEERSNWVDTLKQLNQ